MVMYIEGRAPMLGKLGNRTLGPGIPYVTLRLEDSRGQGSVDRIVHRQTANTENRKGRVL